MKYFPYLRGKQEELLALHELGDFLSTVGELCPIVEPVKEIKKPESKNPLKEYQRQVEAGYPIGFIMNPSHGEFRRTPEPTRRALLQEHLAPHANFIPTLLVAPTTPVTDLASFAATWQREVGIVHAGMFPHPEAIAATLQGRIKFQVFRRDRTNLVYRQQCSEGISVLLGDGFTRAERNKDYPEREFFSDLLYSHAQYGYGGFGDFLTQGDYFSPGGGAAIAVAIHLTNAVAGDLWVHHFLSERKDGKGVDTPGKFLEALTKACTFIRSPENYCLTRACRDFLELEANSHYPGLGRAKRISLKHHLELVGTALGNL